ncbi:hypothetical protein [Cellulomonas wangsupingiae]|uniref:hypothetical protein n=1 Tax=Cellulomonas wangsupingiae TaxID=2968085 RepID=UPI001D0E137A|nr:hypothetical protein [Cellulomonas wangsupingiae]MCM0641577.1 hypothetical protein [Cellulomonas wangsupingiae]
MTNTPLTSPSTTTPRGSVRWPVVLLLAATVLLWPLLGAAGLDDLALAAVVVPVTALTWVAVLGLRDAPRPVLTGTLAGLLYGGVLVALSVGFGGGFGGGRTAGVVLLGAVWELTWGALLGAGAGLLGGGVRQLRSSR